MRERAHPMRRAALITIVSCILTVGIGALPAQAHADAPLNVLTLQLLPPGANTCIQQQVLVFTPYVYGNSLDAVEYTLSDSSYVALVASAGDTSIPFQFMTRQTDSAGNLRIHIDMSVPISGDLPLKIILLSAGGQGKHTCATYISTHITQRTLSGTVSGMKSTNVAVVTTPKVPQHVGGVSFVPSTSAPVISVTATAGGQAASVVAGFQSKIVGMCLAGNASRLWFVLLAIYALIVAAVTFGKEYVPLARSVEWVAAAIVVPLIALFGFWYLAESCRTTAWVPAISILIALAGLASAFTGTSVKNVIQLPAAAPPLQKK